MTHLDRKKCLDGNGQLIEYQIPPAPTRVWDNNRAKKSGKLRSLQNHHTDDIANNCILTNVYTPDRLRVKEVVVLLDTGASDDDYISENLVRQLGLDNQVFEANSIVCPIGRTCTIINKRININLCITDELTNKEYFFSINPAIFTDLRDEDEDIILGNTSLTRFEIASHLPTHFGLTRLNIINMAREIMARQNDNEVINPSRDERLTKGYTTQVAVDATTRELQFVSPAIVFTNLERACAG